MSNERRKYPLRTAVAFLLIAVCILAGVLQSSHAGRTMLPSWRSAVLFGHRSDQTSQSSPFRVFGPAFEQQILEWLESKADDDTESQISAATLLAHLAAIDTSGLTSSQIESPRERSCRLYKQSVLLVLNAARKSHDADHWRLAALLRYSAEVGPLANTSPEEFAALLDECRVADSANSLYDSLEMAALLHRILAINLMSYNVEPQGAPSAQEMRRLAELTQQIRDESRTVSLPPGDIHRLRLLFNELLVPLEEQACVAEGVPDSLFHGAPWEIGILIRANRKPVAENFSPNDLMLLEEARAAFIESAGQIVRYHQAPWHVACQIRLQLARDTSDGHPTSLAQDKLLHEERALQDALWSAAVQAATISVSTSASMRAFNSPSLQGPLEPHHAAALVTFGLIEFSRSLFAAFLVAVFVQLAMRRKVPAGIRERGAFSWKAAAIAWIPSLALSVSFGPKGDLPTELLGHVKFLESQWSLPLAGELILSWLYCGGLFWFLLFWCACTPGLSWLMHGSGTTTARRSMTSVATSRVMARSSLWLTVAIAVLAVMSAVWTIQLAERRQGAFALQELFESYDSEIRKETERLLTDDKWIAAYVAAEELRLQESAAVQLEEDKGTTAAEAERPSSPATPP